MQDTWIPTGSLVYNGDLGGGLGSGITSDDEQTDVVHGASIWTTIKNLNFNQLREDLSNRALFLMGISVNDFADQQDIDYFKEGIGVGIDDNILYGWYNRIVGLDKDEDEFFYLAGHQIVDEAAIAYFAATTVNSALAAQASFALAAAEGTGGLLLEATGVGAVGGVVLQADALRNVAVGVASSIVSGVAAVSTTHSVTLLNATTGKMNNLPTYNAGNFNPNLKNLVGDPPSGMVNPQAHHVLPQKFVDFFKSKGIDIHDPKYGSWVAAEEHSWWTYDYNLDWEYLINSPEWESASISYIENFARFISQKYSSYLVHF